VVRLVQLVHLIDSQNLGLEVVEEEREVLQILMAMEVEVVDQMMRVREVVEERLTEVEVVGEAHSIVVEAEEVVARCLLRVGEARFEVVKNLLLEEVGLLSSWEAARVARCSMSVP